MDITLRNLQENLKSFYLLSKSFYLKIKKTAQLFGQSRLLIILIKILFAKAQKIIENCKLRVNRVKV